MQAPSFRKPAAKRLFVGLAGSPLAQPEKLNNVKNKPKPCTLTELLAQQRVESEKIAAERDWRAFLESEGWEPGDDQPVVVSSRGRNRNRGSEHFQRYQFRLRSNGDKNARFDRGADPAIYGNLAASKQVRESGLDAEGAETKSLHKASGKAESDFVDQVKFSPSPVTIAAVAQSMPKGYSVGVLSSSLQYADIPREPTASIAWVFSDVRFKYFISRFVSDDALRAFDIDDPQTLKPFARSLKIFACLWFHFRLGKTDKSVILDDPDLRRLRLWRSTNALKRYRCDVLKEGLALFKTPAEGRTEFEDFDLEKVNAVWSAVQKIYRQHFQ